MDNAGLDALTLEKDERAIIGRLAELSPLKYDKERSAAARELGVSVGALIKPSKRLELPEPTPRAKAGP
jgi:hypothetical protein